MKASIINRRQFAGGMAAILAVTSSGIALAMPSESPLEELRRICQERGHRLRIDNDWLVIDQTLLLAIFVDVQQALAQHPLNYAACDQLRRRDIVNDPDRAVERKLNDLARALIGELRARGLA